MPPKNKQVDARGEEELATDGDTVYGAGGLGSPASSSSSGSSITVSADHLHQILQANQRSMAEANQSLVEANQIAMAALLASTPHLAASTPVHVSTPPKKVTIPVPKWGEEDTPSEFFLTYEQAQLHNGVDRAVWGTLLPVYLPGRAKAAYFQLDPALMSNYDRVKSEMLTALGDTPSEAGRKWWTITRNSGEDIGAFTVRLRTIGMRMFDDVVTKEEVVERVVLSRFMYLLSSDCYTQVSGQKPKTCAEASKMVQEFEGTRAFAKRFQDRRAYSSSYSSNHHYKRENSSGSGNHSVSNTDSSSGERPSSPEQQQPQATGSQPVGSPGEKQEYSWRRERKPIVCYGCGEPGHIKPNCPARVRSVKYPGGSEDCLITACLGGREAVGVRMDTGADRTLVRSDFVPQDAYLKGTVKLGGYRGHQVHQHRRARLTIKVGPIEQEVCVAVEDDLEYPALLGDDLSRAMKSEILGLVKETVDARLVEEKGGRVRITRAQAAQQKASEDSDCEPKTLGDILDIPDAYLVPVLKPTPVAVCDTWPEVGEEEVEVGEELEISLPTLKKDTLVEDGGEKSNGAEEEMVVSLSEIFDFTDDYFKEEVEDAPVAVCDTWPEECDELEMPLPTLKEDSVVELPLPCLGGTEGNGFVAEQLAVGALQEVLAKKAEKSNGVEDEVIVQTTGDSVQSMVVPTGRTQQRVKLYNNNLVVGHGGLGKKIARIRGYFGWPRIWGQVMTVVRGLCYLPNFRVANLVYGFSTKMGRHVWKIFEIHKFELLLGLLGCYRRFVSKDVEHSGELTQATRESTSEHVCVNEATTKTSPDRVVLSNVLLAECSYLKKVLCSIPSLTLPVSQDSFLLQTDAPGVGLGAVLSVTREGKKLPFAFYSRNLQSGESCYGAAEFQELAVSVQKVNANADALSRCYSEEEFTSAPSPSDNHWGGGGDVRKTLPLQAVLLTLRQRTLYITICELWEHYLGSHPVVNCEPMGHAGPGC